jgi:ABC-type transport system involved in multi-copper enzyme maturation permease subunit
VIRLIRSELLKLRTTPGPWVVLAVTLAFTAIGVTLTFLVAHQQPGQQQTHLQFVAPDTITRLRRLVGAAFVFNGEWMAAIIGVLCITGEYRHKVLTTTLLASPKRPNLLVAKGATVAVWGIILGLGSLVMVAAYGLPLLASQGGSISNLLHQVGYVLPGLFGAFVLLALFGLGFGTLLKNQVAAVLAVLAIAFVVEPIIDGLWPWIGRWLPSAATDAVAGHIVGRDSSLNLLSWWLATLVLLGWALAPTVIGYFVTLRRDVT